MKITILKLMKKKYVYKSLKLFGIRANRFNTYFYDVFCPELGGFVLTKKYGLVQFYTRNSSIFVCM